MKIFLLVYTEVDLNMRGYKQTIISSQDSFKSSQEDLESIVQEDIISLESEGLPYSKNSSMCDTVITTDYSLKIYKILEEDI